MTTYISLPPVGSAYWADPVATSASLPTTDPIGTVRVALDTGTIYEWNGASWSAAGSTADVLGPGSATVNAVARFDGTTGKLIKNSSVTIDDTGEITSASLTGSRALVTGASKQVQSATTTATEIGYVNGVTSAIQTQLDAKQATITGGATTITSSNLTVSRALASDGSGKVAVATTTATELGYVNGVTSAIQTQIDAKQVTITGGATTITGSNLTVSRALVSDGSGKVAVATTTATELGYVNGVTSAVQTQIDTKIATGSVASVASLTLSGAGGLGFIEVKVQSSPPSTPASAFLRFYTHLNNVASFLGSSGYIADLDFSALAASRAYAFPDAAGTVVLDTATQTLTNKTLTAPVLGAASATTVAVGGTLVASTVATFTSTTGGLLLPRMTTTQRDALTGVNGLLIYNSTLDRFQGYTAGAWVSLQGFGN